MIDVRKDVLAATGGKQVPWDHSALTGEFFFKQTAAATANRSTTDSVDPETQSRLRTLEDEVKKKSDAEQTGNIVALAQARERLRQLSEENKADQQRIFDKQYETGSTGDSTSRTNLAMAIGKIQMQMVRRNQQAEKLREEIKALEGKLGITAEKTEDAEVARLGLHAPTAGRALRRCPCRGTRQKTREPVEVDVDYRRREQRQHLADQQAADHRVAERLADLGARAGAEHQRHAAEQRRHRRHHDRAEAQQRGLADGLLRRQVLRLLGVDGEVDQHDAVLLDDADRAG